jgi:tRNA A-37 threonylcarbamoyl transferase component Bud32
MKTIESIGKYDVKRQLGRGAIGTVYEGWDPIIARRVAIKTVRFPDASDLETEGALTRFRREAQAAGKLTHPNIVGVFDYGETNDLAYIVMEYVDGLSLKTLLDKQERLVLADTLRIMDNLLAGLQFSHEHGVVHRDIKPANVMLTGSGQVKIADFGIARIENSLMTQAGTVLGTPAYMSPEQFMGQVVDARSDIYSSGLLLYQLLTGERPFDGSMSAIMHKALNTEPPPPSQLSVTAPPAFDAVVRRAMAKRPEDRYPSAAAFAAAIKVAANQSEPIGDTDPTMVAASRQVAPSTLPIAVTQGAKRLPLPMIAAAVVVFLVLAGGGIWRLLQRSPSDRADPAPTSMITTTAPQTATTAVARPPSSSAVATTSQPVPVPLAPLVAPPSQPPNLPPSLPVASQPPQVIAPSTPPSLPAQAAAIQAPLPVTQAPSQIGQTGPPDGASPQPTTIPSGQPDAEPTVIPNTSPLTEQPGREALVVPPPAAVPKPTLSRLDLVRATAQSLPCSVLNVTSGPDGLRVSGLAFAGQRLDRLLAELRDVGRLADDITRVDRFACTPITTVATAVRRSWDNMPPTFAIRLNQRAVASGVRLGIDLATTLSATYVDLYQGDGLVRHLLRPAPSGTATKTHATWVAEPPPGPRLVVAIGSATPLDLGTRPETEKAADYLAVLQARLENVAVPPTADLAMVMVRAAEPTLAKVPQLRQPTLRSDRCANIISRVQLGEMLSDAELAALRTECRS